MNKLNLLAVVLAVLLVACERPNSPDFKLEQSVQTPLVLEREYQFLGGSGALIDTTSTDFDSLFTVDGDGLVSLSIEEKLEFQNLESLVPVISASSTQIDAAVGDIKLDDFSSQSQLGSADFQDISGEGTDLNQGEFLSGGSGSANISLDTDYFVSATVSSTNGTVTINVRNDLGFDANGSPSGLIIDLRSGSTVLDTDSQDVPDGESRDFTFDLAQGAQLANLNVDITANWNGQPMSRDAGELVIQDLQGNDLEASQVTAAVSPQDFTSSGQSLIDDTEFEMTQSDHYIELESGQLHIHQIVNNLDVDIDQLVVSFPDIRSAPFNPSDSLVVRFENQTAIPRNSQNQVEKTRDLSGFRVFGQNDVIAYNVSALTENAQQGPGSENRTITNTDNIQAAVNLENLEISRGLGILKPRDVILNEDDPANGTSRVDIFNDNEAEEISIDGLSALSDKISGIEFANPVLTLNYETNIGTLTEVFSTIAATNSQGEQMFLKGSSGSPYEVGSGEAQDVLRVNGSAAGADRMIKFNIDTTWSGTISSSVEFNRDNSNLDSFFNILPSDIRFIINTSLNDGSEEGLVRSPIIFDPSLSLDLPMNIASAGSSYEDTLTADLGGLPGEGDDTRLIDANINIAYLNGLPLRFNLGLTFLDEQGQEITSVPLQGGEPLEIEAASVNQQTRYVEQTNEGQFVLGLNESQMENINSTRSLILNASFNTTGQDNVRIRAEDSITFTIGINVEIETTVN